MSPLAADLAAAVERLLARARAVDAVRPDVTSDDIRRLLVGLAYAVAPDATANDRRVQHEEPAGAPVPADRAVAFGDPRASEETRPGCWPRSRRRSTRFEERLTAYMRGLGIPELSDAEMAELGIDPSDFAEWSAYASETET